MTCILAIETSCDETAAAVVVDGRQVLSNVVASQIEIHRRYGGVFPEVASRQHVLAITPVIRQAMADAGAAWSDLDAVAVTEGPGLAGSLLVGVNAAKGIALARGLPLVAVNHLEGHVYSNWLEPEVRGQKAEGSGQRAEIRSQREEGRGQEPGRSGLGTEPSSLPASPRFAGHEISVTRDTSSHPSPPAERRSAPSTFPILVLIVSGGHTELVLMEGHGRYRRLGGTLDDAAGEAFDKAARLLGLSYPGGPAIQRVAEGGDPARFPLPRALTGAVDPQHRFNFSFSGLKTAVLRAVREQADAWGDPHWPQAYAAQAEGRGEAAPGESALTAPKVQAIRDLAASFQAAVADVLVTKTLLAAEECAAAHVCVCGGVAANRELRRQLAERTSLPYSIPPIWLCTDNAAMVGAAGHYRFLAGLRAGFDLDVKARLPLASWG
ncbi:MAG: tRNA (adenosine(37)-N6)-threonylcarbamoyltransferase complex transferase subunit TsaD [Anaerolineae bacterium]|nr:tRNA (adenosine(37)-N6)-threonylcarbamoyltransferase complex transferase subunit TsaD [Anaerolineae bacterium]